MWRSPVALVVVIDVELLEVELLDVPGLLLDDELLLVVEDIEDVVVIGMQAERCDTRQAFQTCRSHRRRCPPCSVTHSATCTAHAALH